MRRHRIALRGWLAYQAPWVQNLGGSLVAPRCLGAGEQTGVAAWMALEDLSDLAGQPWPLARFHTVARHLGVFNGAYLAGQPIPEDAWLSRDWLRGWTERAGQMVALLPTVADHPLVRQVFPESTITAFGELWDDRNAVFAALDRLPQTLCHRDIFPRNVFVRHTAEADHSVAIDWAFTGPGAVGEELAALVGASLAFFEAEPADASKLEHRCLSGYLEGLRSAG
ncbi:MAG TPA: phosphotransferase, partial [Roseiflexaceae bacterium]|nr:phosphotransferase [Roseiflexaceae bacterium]